MQIVFTPTNALKETFFHLTAFKAYGQIKVLRIDIRLIPYRSRLLFNPWYDFL